MSVKSSSLGSSASGKDPSSAVTSKQNGNSEKAQCDLCKLSYISQAKLTEHLVSLMHHTKLDESGKNKIHECILCRVTFTDMAKYREHIGTIKHVNKLKVLHAQNKEKDSKRKDLTNNNKGSRDHFGEFGKRNSSTSYPTSNSIERWQVEFRQPQGLHRGGNPHHTFQNWNSNQHSSNQFNQDYFMTQEGQQIPWGSGAANFRQGGSYDLQNIMNHVLKYSNGGSQYGQNQQTHNLTHYINFDRCWDELSIQQHEDFLADMDQSYPQRFEESQSYSSQPLSLYKDKNSGRRNMQETDLDDRRDINWPPSSDRKRPRYEDNPLESVAKSHKTYGRKELQETGSKTKIGCQSSDEKNPTDEGKAALEKGRTVDQNRTSSLDNASDTILERAEKLCKELREKREASYTHRANVLKSQSQQSINDKMNSLKKDQQSYLKGHLKGKDKDKQSSNITSIVSSSSETAASVKTSFSSSSSNTNKKLSASSSKIKTLEEIRNSIEQSVLDDVQCTSTSQGKVNSRRRTTSLGESTVSSQGPESSLGKPTLEVDLPAKPPKPSQKSDSAGVTVPKIGAKPLSSRPAITKEHLNKMVNCPRSRTERVHLARMFQSREDNRSTASISSRSNINMEGLYDTTIPDIQLDVGGDLPTIKLEELSDGVRAQILDLIQDDITSTQSELEKIETTEDVSTKESGGKNSDSLRSESKASEVQKIKPRKVSKTSHSSSNETKDNSVVIGSMLSKGHNRLNPTVVVERLNLDKSHSLDSGIEKSGQSSQSSLETICDGDSVHIGKFAAPGVIDKGICTDISAMHVEETEKSAALSSENILSRYPTILRNLKATPGKPRSDTIMDENDATSLLDSVRSSMPDSPLPLPSSSSLLSSSQSTVHPLLTSTLSYHASSIPTHSQSQLDDHTNAATQIEQDKSSSAPSNDVSGATAFSSSEAVTRDSISNERSTMSELLTLSEQEECVKQEMTSMELRLTRLHRLLEQAVNQINKCTERRNQLQDEEKNLTNRRLLLLREAATSSKYNSTDNLSVKASKPSSGTATFPRAPLSQATSDNSGVETAVPSRIIGDSSGGSETVTHSSLTSRLGSMQEESLDVEEARPESSLSRSEWLAKFSAYLPRDPLLAPNASATLGRHPSSSLSSLNRPANLATSVAHSSHAQSSVSESNHSAALQMVPEQDSQPSTCREATMTSTTTALPSSLFPESRFAAPGSEDCGSSDNMAVNRAKPFVSPIVYVGTIKSDETGKKKNDSTVPVMLLCNENISSLFNKDCGGRRKEEELEGNVNAATNSKEDLTHHRTVPGAKVHPGMSRAFPGSPRQEDSDIGSVASIASGSSLGEQISRYCKFTPGASVDSLNRHELSVILSGPSDTSDLRGVEDQQDTGNNSEEAEDMRESRKTAQLKEDIGNKRLYGHLDHESIRSAEALHIQERNHEVPSTSSADKKKKKRKTKHQRDSGIRGRPKPYVITSSSADENEMTSSRHVENTVSSLDLRQWKSPESTSDNDSSDLPSATLKSSKSSGQNKNQNKSVTGTEITVAECDSSTNLGLVDTQSLNACSSKLKEMNESFEKNFGRKPKYVGKSKPGSSKSGLSNESTDFHIVVSDSDSDGDAAPNSNSIDLRGDDDSERFPSRGSSNSRTGTGSLVFPSTLGAVCFLRCRHDTIYAGFLHCGFKVLHMAEASSSQSQEQQFEVPQLTCMEVAPAIRVEEDQVFVGVGDFVVKVEIKSGERDSIDLGTSVKCLHVSQNTLFSGLDTGEIHCQDIKGWKEKNRYICSDCPIHAMASGWEAGSRLLCVASQDATIIVVDADRCLPLRILVGHTKTAFSVQVYGQYVYSGSGNGAVIIHNLHTARVEKTHKDNKGIINCVFYSNNFLFTGGTDRLIRCYCLKSHKLVQVYYGADKGAIKSLYVYQDTKLITGNSVGSIEVVELNLKAKNVCKHKKCGLNFGLASHLTWHLQQEHMAAL